jgi:hypothetical protein
MNIKNTQPSDPTLSQALQADFTHSATISMSNQTRSSVPPVKDASRVVQLRERNLTAEEEDASQEEEPVHSVKEKVLIWLASFMATGYFFSLLFHSTILTIMAIVIVGGMEGDDHLSTLVTLDDEDNFSFNGPLDTRIEEEAGGQTTEFNVMQPIKNLTGETEEALKEIEADVSVHLGKGEGDAEGDGSGNGGGEFKFKPMGNAVTAGSFTAWTVPKDPDLNEDYLIIIQVKLPSSFKSSRYRAADLLGLVMGTDEHRQAIPWDVRWPNSTFTSNAKGEIRPVKKGGFLPLKNRQAQLIVKVPGSKIPATRDTIKIQSKLLKEKQTLQIEF